MITKWIILFTVVAIPCDSQLADHFFPELTKTTRDVVDGLTKTPLATFTTKATGNLIAAAVKTATWGPDLLARVLGVGNSLPILPIFVSDNNIVDSVDKYVAAFNSGLGNEDARLPITSLIPKYGHPIEEHEVVTEDGYILTMHRIPGNGSVTFLMHGLLGSADDYVIAGPDDGLAYLLANDGYDVWLGNARGNKHSRRHVQFKPAQASFWDFSWHEIGILDLPAMIDYVLDKTNQTSIKYIGHSQGTTTFFVMASERPEYNEKISLMIALSPVAYMSHVTSPIVRLFAPGTSFIYALSKSFGIYEFLPDDGFMRILKLLICGSGALSEIVCSNIVFLAAGFDFAQLNFTNLPVMLGHLPSGASIKQFAHYGQGIISRDFRKFDYGTVGNLEEYGTEIPPTYTLESVSAPVSLFYSNADWMAHPDDVNSLYQRLKNPVDIYKIPHDQFNHLDYLVAKDVKSLLYKRLWKLLKHF